MTFNEGELRPEVRKYIDGLAKRKADLDEERAKIRSKKPLLKKISLPGRSDPNEVIGPTQDELLHPHSASVLTRRFNTPIAAVQMRLLR